MQQTNRLVPLRLLEEKKCCVGGTEQIKRRRRTTTTTKKNHVWLCYGLTARPCCDGWCVLKSVLLD